jgi:Type II secretory pathway, component PulF
VVVRRWIRIDIVCEWLIWGAHVTGINLVKGYGWVFDQLLLKLPLVGTTQVKATTARVSLLMASLFGAGIGVDRILNIASDITTNRVLKSALDDVADGVTRGAPLSQLFQDSGLFPSDLSQMLLVGEETGKLDQMLSSLADYYQQELESSVDALVAILEPLMVVIVGLIIGGLILALYLPVFSLGSTITG